MANQRLPDLLLFIRCGDRYAPPKADGSWVVITLASELDAEGIPEAVARVRSRLRGARSARVLIAGPVTLGVALGQGLAHEPVEIEYLQVWVSNPANF
ncbi:MAG: hypothetical protein GY856_16415 [bacterium]|nr:hypothetical protein [bacterium]